MGRSTFVGYSAGLTEFLPVSSSGHLEIGQLFLALPRENLTFAIIVHAATVLSPSLYFGRNCTIFSVHSPQKWNAEKDYVAKIGISMIPIFIVGIFLKTKWKHFSATDFVGRLLLAGNGGTADFAYLPNRAKENISYLDAFIIGLAQAVACCPIVAFRFYHCYGLIRQ